VTNYVRGDAPNIEKTNSVRRWRSGGMGSLNRFLDLPGDGICYLPFEADGHPFGLTCSARRTLQHVASRIADEVAQLQPQREPRLTEPLGRRPPPIDLEACDVDALKMVHPSCSSTRRCRRWPGSKAIGVRRRPGSHTVVAF